MNKSSPLARGVRTFAHLMVGVLAAATTVDWFGKDVHMGEVTLTLGVIAALLGGIVAFIYAYIPTLPNANTPLTKALATFLQGVAAGLATVGLADLTTSAVASFGQNVVRVLVAAAFAALSALAVNSSEDATPAPPA